jgi:hypothetical protein
MRGSTPQPSSPGLLSQPLAYGTEVLVGGIRGKRLGNGWVEGFVMKQHPSGRVTVRIHGRNHVVSRKEVVPKRLSFTVAVPEELGRPEAAPGPVRPQRQPLGEEHWWVDEDEVTVRDENRLVVAVAAGPEDAELIARAPQMQHAIQRTLERLEHETGAPLNDVIAELKAAVAPAFTSAD